MSGKPKTKYLGKTITKPTKQLDIIPWKGGLVRIELDCSEFTSFCPVTGQPDFAHFKITYAPDKHIVETKSMKLYMQSFRNDKAFNEVLVSSIASDFFQQVSPKWVSVEGKFNARGGIAVTCNRFLEKRFMS